MNPSASSLFPPPEAQGGWPTVVPPNAVPTGSEKAEILRRTGIDWDALNRAWEFDLHRVGFAPEEGRQKSLLVIRNGWVAGEWYHDDQGNLTKDTKVAFASGTKTLVGACFARLFTQGRCSNSDFLHEYLPASWGDAEPARKRIQLRHVLTMTSGLDPYDGPYPQDAYYDAIINLRVEAEPGAVWAYSTGPLDLLNLVLRAAGGMDLLAFTNAEILAPIGAAPAEARERFTFHGNAMCSTIRLTPRDYARIGCLFLRGGAWASDRIISSEVVSLVTQWPAWLGASTMRVPNFASEAAANETYAYTFWLNRTGSRLAGFPKDAFMASGGAHKMVVCPSENAIVVRNGNYRRDRDVSPHLYRLIYDAVTDRNPAAEV